MICLVCGQTTRDRLICPHCGAALGASKSAHSTSSLAALESDDYLFWAAGGVMYTSGIGSLALRMIRPAAINPPAEPRTVGYLAVYLDDDSWGGTAVPLDERVVTIGRSAECTICLAHDPQVSYFHAIISFRGAGYTLTDVGSSNGTLLNNVPIAGECPLRGGDMIRIGHCELVYSSAPHHTDGYSDFSSGLPGSRDSSLEANRITSESAEFATRAVAVHTPRPLASPVAKFVQHMLSLATGFRRFQSRVNKNARVLAVNVRVKAPRSKRFK
jgi:FHA domain-containing protein